MSDFSARSRKTRISAETYLLYVAQGNPQFDAEIAKKRRFRTGTSSEPGIIGSPNLILRDAGGRECPSRPLLGPEVVGSRSAIAPNNDGNGTSVRGQNLESSRSSPQYSEAMSYFAAGIHW